MPVAPSFLWVSNPWWDVKYLCTCCYLYIHNFSSLCFSFFFLRKLFTWAFCLLIYNFSGYVIGKIASTYDSVYFGKSVINHTSIIVWSEVVTCHHVRKETVHILGPITVSSWWKCEHLSSLFCYSVVVFPATSWCIAPPYSIPYGLAISKYTMHRV